MRSASRPLGYHSVLEPPPSYRCVAPYWLITIRVQPVKIAVTDTVWPEMSVFVEGILSRWWADDFAKQFSDDLEISGVQCHCLVLHDALLHLNNIRTLTAHLKGYKPSEHYKFSEKPSEATSSLYRVAYDDIFFRSLQQIVFGHAFEKLRELAVVRYGHRRTWPPIFEVGYHIRNGSFHGNRFRFTQPIAGTPRWRGLTVTPALEGTVVMGRSDGVMGLADIPLLLSELQACV